MHFLYFHLNKVTDVVKGNALKHPTLNRIIPAELQTFRVNSYLVNVIEHLVRYFLQELINLKFKKKKMLSAQSQWYI